MLGGVRARGLWVTGIGGRVSGFSGAVPCAVHLLAGPPTL